MTSALRHARRGSLPYDGRSVYRDDKHLSTAGAELVDSSLEQCFDGVE
jgi:hypothetical protein